MGSAEDIKRIFDRFGTVCSATIMCDSNGQSKCFGFVLFAEHAAASSALAACATGRVILEDKAFKVWHLKASWAQKEGRVKGSRLAAVSRHTTQFKVCVASKETVRIASQGKGPQLESSAGRRATMPPGFALNV